MDPSHKRNFKGKLRNKIFFFMVLIGILPLACAVVLTEYVFTDSHKEDVSKVEAAVLQEKAVEIHDFIGQDILTPTQLEIPDGGSMYSTSSIEDQNFILGQSLKNAPFLQYESYVNIEGQETARVDRSDPTGYPASALQDLSASPAFQAALAGNNYIGPVSYPGNIPTVEFASPIKDQIGETIGVIYGIATLAPLQDIIGSSTIGNTGYIYLVDQHGVVIAGGGNFAGAIGTSTVALPIVREILPGNNLLTPATQMRYTSIFGQSVVAAGMSISEYGRPWALIAEWPTAEADASELLVREIIILLIVLVFVLIVLLSIFLALFITRPVKKLEEATARVAQGQFDEGVNIRTGDELEELGGSFNAMISGLKQFESLKDEFVFIAAHELKTPVSAMKGYLTLILEGSTGETTEQTKDFIQKVLGSDQRLIQLVNDLLEVARSQAGRLTIKVAPTSPTKSP
jgi:HAMP domain-containing protein